MNCIQIVRLGVHSIHRGTEAEVNRIATVAAADPRARIVDGPRALTPREAMTGSQRGAPCGISDLRDESLITRWE